MTRKRMEKRTTREVVGMFFFMPIIGGSAIVAFSVAQAVRFGDQLTFAEWILQVLCGAVLGLGVAITLPVVGWKEIQKRRQVRSAKTCASHTPSTE